ncbi:universal stress protein [Methanobacterium formicicum]|uniref:Universal stress protein UspA3 n=1 Tax=Methanobacterium formicicum TaxID=2162 RepID=A0A089ZHT8_METFO|nr:universal stress protein [Methanobacterium formicicum]AIS32018.1 universal stress protein UspA3 [Methanobacterium formicicum]CEL24750.1 UspA domain-containing protein [Methanobacterium formicicum]
MIYQTYKKILLPTNGSDYANKALKHAVWFASASGSEIIALNVINPSSLATLPEEHIRIQTLELLKEEGNKALQKIFDLLKSKTDENYPEKIKLTPVIKEGSPADTIVKTVEEEGIDLITIGTSGKQGVNRLLLGSLAEKVVMTAPCPVLVVH